MARKRKKRTTMHVIFASPRQWNGPNHYIAEDGTVTDSKKRAAKFFTYEEAREFAKTKKIELSETRYIQAEDFGEFDI